MKNILIVDDEQQILDLVSDILEEHFPEANLVTAMDGLEAFVKSHNLTFDLIITDHKMPYCTGLDFIKKMRATDNLNGNSPIIMISGYIPEIESEISSLENLYYMDKPFKIERLLKYCKIILNS